MTSDDKKTQTRTQTRTQTHMNVQPKSRKKKHCDAYDKQLFSALDWIMCMLQHVQHVKIQK